MFHGEGLTIEMFKGDFGEKLPINITEGEILEGDILRFIIETPSNEKVINKIVDVYDGMFVFSLTKAETSLLGAGEYLWGLKQYRDDYLVDTLVANNKFIVKRGQ